MAPRETTDPHDVFRTARRSRRYRRRLLILALMVLPLVAAGYTSIKAAGWANLESTDHSADPAGSEKPASGGSGRQGASPPWPEKSCDDLRVLVNNEHPLPPSYRPDDLVSLRRHGIRTVGGDLLLRREAARNLRRLVAAAAADGEKLAVVSAYRSYEEQRRTFARYTRLYGNMAGRVSAAPGQSEHQLGTTVDFANAETDYKLRPSFAETSASRWLLRNARKYGFVISYPEDSEARTGIQWEAWHYRYIGRENAQRLVESGLIPSEFLAREGVVPRC